MSRARVLALWAAACPLEDGSGRARRRQAGQRLLEAARAGDPMALAVLQVAGLRRWESRGVRILPREGE